MAKRFRGPGAHVTVEETDLATTDGVDQRWSGRRWPTPVDVLVTKRQRYTLESKRVHALLPQKPAADELNAINHSVVRLDSVLTTRRNDPS